MPIKRAQSHVERGRVVAALWAGPYDEHLLRGLLVRE